MSAALISAGTPFLFSDCAGALASFRTQVRDGVLTVPKSEIEPPENSTGILIVHASSMPGPIVVRRHADVGIVALLSICTHRGCEVRPMPHSLQCPCHGSEYDVEGNVIEGPAPKPLTRFPVQETADSIIIRV